MGQQISIQIPIRDQVADIIRRRILNGELAPNSQISERELRDELHVSVTPIKEAIRTLCAEGLLYTLPRKGTYVTNLGDDPISQMRQIVYLSSAVEGTSAYFGALSISAEDIEKMEALLRRSLELIEDMDSHREEIARNNNLFHLTLYNACNSQFILNSIDNMRSIKDSIRVLSLRSKNDYISAYHEHQAILDAVRKRDPALAESRTISHIRMALERTVKRHLAV